MKIKSIVIKNFRRLERARIDLELDETVFVGPNNGGKTSASAIFRCFLGGKDFKVHDFSVSRISGINIFGDGGDVENLPAIELDIWLSIDPNSIEFGRAFFLLPELSVEFDCVGIRLKYKVRDPARMRASYEDDFPVGATGKRERTLAQYLGIDANLKKHYEVVYYSLEGDVDKPIETQLDDKNGKSLLQDLVRVDFVNAQRNVDDDEGSRSSRLSTAFAAFYKKNLDQPKEYESAHQVINENNQRLTEHYERHFSRLMSVIRGLGVPSINDRSLKLVSALSPQEALQGSTDLIYIDSERNHELPESYNGLGFKNLIYMAIQISHYHLHWMKTERNRPLCQLIFVEEPEVHLHAQVQQTFITNIWQIISDAAKEEGEDNFVPQLVISTHSSHILDAVDFAKVRYFERCELEGEDRQIVRTFNASRVHDLRRFQPEPLLVGARTITPDDAQKFLKKYLKMTHCDLFFADAVILVEGTVEKLLLPKMIEKSAPRLREKYLSILEVGGAYSHRFSGLLRFLNIPYLVITDLDSVRLEGKHPACRGDEKNALTSNASLKSFYGVNTVIELLQFKAEQKIDFENDRCVCFQTGVHVIDKDKEKCMTPRTIEESFAYENFDLLRSGDLTLGVDLPDDLLSVYQVIYEHIKSSNFKKTEFALDVLSLETDWQTPLYIAEGLQWLENRLDCTKFTQAMTDN